MKIPLLYGMVSDETAEFRQSYPLNLEPFALKNGIATGQLRGTAGATGFANGPGIDRGGTMWNDMLYRAMGTRLIRVRRSNQIEDLGDLGDGVGPVTFAVGPDRLGIRSGDKLFYWNDIALSQVTDPDLGPVSDLIWIDGYFMSTDGVSVVVTELSDPSSVQPLKYGSAEEDPDPITGLIQFNGEAYVLGRYSIQVFRNMGTSGFPFQTIQGATIPYGCVGAMAKCLYDDAFAFVGGDRNSGLGVFLAGAGTATPISTRRIEDELAKVDDPSSIVLENRSGRAERRLFVHLPDKTLVFCSNHSAAAGEPVWYFAQSGIGKPYRLRSAVLAYGSTVVGDTESTALGTLSDTVNTHFGESAQWQFDVGLLYNEGKGGILKGVELIGLPGRAPPGVNGSVWLSLTRDGENYTTERPCSMGLSGQHGLRLQWRPRTNFRTYLGMRFRGYSPALPGFAACEAGLMPLAA